MPGAGRTHGPPATRKAGDSDHRFSQNIRHSLRDGVTAYTCSPRRPGFVASVTSRITPRSLTPASGGQDHTTLPSASRAARQATRLRPSHPDPYVRGGARSPLWWNQDGRRICMIPISDKAKYFSWEGWTGRNRLRLLGKLAFRRRPPSRCDLMTLNAESASGQPTLRRLAGNLHFAATMRARDLSLCRTIPKVPRSGCVTVRFAVRPLTGA
jgi:hypothetical protein